MSGVGDFHKPNSCARHEFRDRKMRKTIIALLLSAVAIPQLSMAKERTIKVGKTVVYTGEVADKKNPSGIGCIVFNNQPKKAIEADTIRGRFESLGNDFVISDAKATFANGAKFSGMASVLMETLSDKPVVEQITCTLIGCLEWPGKPVMTGEFHVCRKTDCGSNIFELKLEPFDTKDVNTMIYRHGSFKGIIQDGSVPMGKGVLSIIANNHFEEGKVLDVIEGVFNGQNVTEATLSFNSGYKFYGDLSYDVSEKGTDEVYAYNLNGLLIDDKGHQVFRDTAFVICRHTDFNSLRVGIEDFEGISVLRFIDKEYEPFTGCDTVEVSTKLNISEKNKGKWNSTLAYAEKEPVFYYSNGVVVTKTEDGVCVDRKNVSFVVKNNRLTEFLKDYEEGFFHFVKDGQSQIIYKDGSRYEGSLSISSARYCNSIEDELAAYIDVDRMNDYRIMYIDGTTTFANGKKDVWKKGYTEYQANKIAGNYEGRVKLLEQTLREEAKAADMAWEEARPLFEKDYAKRYVDALYGYRLIEGMPLSMFKRVKEMGLPYYDMIGPFSTNHGPFNQYVITIWNRQTADMEYQKVIKFDIFNRLYSISTNF